MTDLERAGDILLQQVNKLPALKAQRVLNLIWAGQLDDPLVQQVLARAKIEWIKAGISVNTFETTH